MVCHQCGSPVDAGGASCPNCGAELKTTKRLELEHSPGLRISQQLKAIKLDAQLFPPGEEVAGRFVLGEMIGRGPFGEVYKARDSEIEADVALKIFDSTVLSSPLDEEAFVNATRAARSMTQPNVVRIHQSGVHKRHPWVSMQHLEGLSLRKVLDLRESKSETFDLAELEPIVSQITLALQHVARDFPHGDLKPENIIFLPELLKVTDAFLLAALPAEAIIPRLEESPYFAPELHTEKSQPAVRADVYSLGVIIGEMMFGPDHTPGTHDGEFAAVDALVKRATAFDPEERYPSVEALSEDLSTLIDTGALLGTSAGPKGPPPPPGTSPPAPPRGPAPADPQEKIATVEYDRDSDAELQDAILTEEVQRGQLPPPQRTKTATAAVPKPNRRTVAAPRRTTDETPWMLIAVIVGSFVLAGVTLVYLNYRPSTGVEEIGEDPGELAMVDDGETSEPTVAERDAGTTPEIATVASIANQKVGEAAGEAVEAVASQTSGQTNGQTNGETSGETSGQTSSGTNGEGGRADDSTRSPDRVGAAKTDDGSRKPAKATGTDCPGGMALVKSKKLGNYCIDRYEYPGGGVMPRTGVSWFEAKKLCAGKGKRLCEMDEWRNACGGRYPYGRTFDASRCNTADEDGFERSLAKTGSFQKCRSRSGAYDMVGNAHEWVRQQRIAGGGFESDEAVGSCRYSSPKSPASSASYIGFRCCADPE